MTIRNELVKQQKYYQIVCLVIGALALGFLAYAGKQADNYYKHTTIVNNV